MVLSIFSLYMQAIEEDGLLLQELKFNLLAVNVDDISTEFPQPTLKPIPGGFRPVLPGPIVITPGRHGPGRHGSADGTGYNGVNYTSNHDEEESERDGNRFHPIRHMSVTA